MAGELEELLEKESLVGTYDSTGTFTLSLAQARSKLKEYQLANLSQGVLKMIQALVQIEPSAIWIEADPQYFTLCWAEPRLPLSPDHFLSDFERVMLGPHCPAKDMAIGLMAFLHRDPKEVWWAEWEGPQAKVTLNLFGGQKQAELRRPPSVFSQSYSLTILAGPSRLVLDRQEIATRTTFAPVNILWNGRLLSELSWNPPTQPVDKVPFWADYYFTQSGPVGQGLALKPNGSSLSLDSSEDARWRGFGRSLKATVHVRRIVGPATHPLQFKGRQSRLSGLASLRNPGNAVGLPASLVTAVGESIWVLNHDLEGPSLLLPVKHGVLLNPCPLPIHLGGVVVVMALPSLQVDLSQFAPLTGPSNWENGIIRLNEQAREIVGLLQEGSKKQWFTPGHRTGTALARGATIGLALCGFAAPYFWAGPVLGAVAGFWIGKWSGDASRRRREKLLENTLGQLQSSAPEPPAAGVAAPGR